MSKPPISIENLSIDRGYRELINKMPNTPEHTRKTCLFTPKQAKPCHHCSVIVSVQYFYRKLLKGTRLMELGRYLSRKLHVKATNIFMISLYIAFIQIWPNM